MLAIAFGSIVVAALPAAGAQQAAIDPAAFIENLGAQAIEGLTGPHLSQSEREARFRTLLAEHFDLPAIGKFVLGRYWRSATDGEQAEFLDVFEDFLVRSYAIRFAEYSGESFQVTGATGTKDDTAIVHSQVVRGRDAMRVDWRVRTRGGQFAILDIIVEGVSMAVTQRSEFAAVIQSRGGKVGGLIEALRQKLGQ
jgi:phospholipid transport system substrate-binding protein